jgi:cobalt-zinc-cadmium efflux system outer membrane protein
MVRDMIRSMRVLPLVVATVCFAQSAPPSVPLPSQSFTWENVKDRFEQNNPTLLADKLNIEESRAQEITAHLRPNPSLGLLADQIDPFNSGPSHGPFAYWLPSATVSYLI